MKIFINKKFKVLNYIVTSDSDSSYISDKYKRLAYILKIFYLCIIVFSVFISFFSILIATKNDKLMLITSLISTFLLIIDYFLWWITYPVRMGENSKYPLLFFPLSGVGIIMILSILPTVLITFSPLFAKKEIFVNIIKVLSIVKILRLILLFNVIPAFKIFLNVMIKQRITLLNVMLFSLIMVIVFALCIYSVEYEQNDKINNYWDALYFTIICMTTIGFGDITPVTEVGRIATVFVSILGVIIFAIPSGIIAGSFMYEIQEKYKYSDMEYKNIKNTSFAETIFLNLKKQTSNTFNRKLDKHENNAKSSNNTELLNVIIEVQGIHETNLIYSKLIDMLGGSTNITNIEKKGEKCYWFYVINSEKINKKTVELLTILELEFKVIKNKPKN